MLDQIKTYVFLVGVVALGFFFVWLPISLNYPSGTYRYRVIVEIDTPEGIKVGSAVREIRVHTEPGFLGVMKQGIDRLVGEAVVVDLGTRGVIFALLSENDLYQAFPYNNGAGILSPEGIRFYKSLKPGFKAPLSREHYPRLVTFTDLNDPSSVKIVNPVALNEIFGEGVALKDIIVEITGDPVTWGIGRWLPWLPMFRSLMLDGNSNQALGTQNATANSMSAGSFTTWK